MRKQKPNGFNYECETDQEKQSIIIKAKCEDIHTKI